MTTRESATEAVQPAGPGLELGLQEFQQLYPAAGDWKLTHVSLAHTVIRKYGVAFPANIRGVRVEGDPDLLIPARLIIVTAGGLKISEPPDSDTLDRLRRTFSCYTFEQDPTTKETIQRILPLPDDLTLPAEARDGIVRKSAEKS